MDAHKWDLMQTLLYLAFANYFTLTVTKKAKNYGFEFLNFYDHLILSLDVPKLNTHPNSHTGAHTNTQIHKHMQTHVMTHLT